MSRAPEARAASVRRRIVVRGRVQGVGFRASVHAEARRLGVAGWVRNCADGSVEAAVEGAPAAVDAFVAYCRRGPRFAAVHELTLSEEPPEGAHGFAIR